MSAPSSVGPKMGASLEEAIGPELAAGEQLVWTGVPAQGWRFGWPDALAVLMVLVAAFYARAVLFMPPPRAPEPKGMFFLAMLATWSVVIYVGGLRLIVDRLRRRRTLYALTDRRVIIAGGLFGRRVKSLFLANLVMLDLQEEKEGRGTLWLAGRGKQGETGMPGVADRRPKLEGIDGAAEVYRRIVELQAALTPRPALP